MIESGADGLRVTVPMLITNASSLLAAGQAHLGSSGEKVFDLSAVTQADSSALALVFAWLRMAQAHGAQLRITHPPASLLSLAQLYGVNELLPLG